MATTTTFDIESNAPQLGVDPESIIEAMDNNAAVSKLPHTLAGFGLATAGMAAYTAVYGHPSGHELAYFIALGGSFFAGVAEVWAALWISRDAPARRGKAKVLLYASVVPFVIALGLSGFSAST